MLLWSVMQRRVVIPYRRLGTTDRSHIQRSRNSKNSLDFLIFEDGTDRFSRNVGKELHSKLHNTPEEHRSHLQRGGSLNSRTVSSSC